MSTSDKSSATERIERQNELTVASDKPWRELLNFWHSLKPEDLDQRKLVWFNEQVAATWAYRDRENAPVVFMSFVPPDMDYLANWITGREEPITKDIQSQNERLRSQVEMLKSLVAQERRNAARETRLHDQLQAHHDETQNKMLDWLAQTNASISTLQAALVGKTEGRLRMAESYHGEVIHVSDDCVVVVFYVDGDLVEQTYNRKQFLDDRLPEKGDRLAAYVHIAKLPAEEEKQVDGIISSHGADKPRKPRKNVVPLPRTF